MWTSQRGSRKSVCLIISMWQPGLRRTRCVVLAFGCWSERACAVCWGKVRELATKTKARTKHGDAKPFIFVELRKLASSFAWPRALVRVVAGRLLPATSADHVAVSREVKVGADHRDVEVDQGKVALLGCILVVCVVAPSPGYEQAFGPGPVAVGLGSLRHCGAGHGPVEL